LVPTLLELRTIHISDLRYIQKTFAVKILSEFLSWLKLLIMLRERIMSQSTLVLHKPTEVADRNHSIAEMSVW